MMAYFVVGVVDATIALLVGLFVFGVPLRGSVLLLAVSTCVFLFGALFWGIFVSAVAKTQVQAYQMGILSSFLPAFLLSGFVYCDRDHAAGDPGDHAHHSGAVRGDDHEGRVSERCRARGAVGRTGVPGAVRGRSIFLLATRKMNQKLV